MQLLHKKVRVIRVLENTWKDGCGLRQGAECWWGGRHGLQAAQAQAAALSEDGLGFLLLVHCCSSLPSRWAGEWPLGTRLVPRVSEPRPGGDKLSGHRGFCPL